MAVTKSVREHIVDLLMQVEKEKTYVQLLLKDTLEDFSGQDKGFITEVVYGTIKYQLKIDYIIEQFSSVKIKKMKPIIRNTLRMSVYQLFYLDKVPDSAVINEAVKLIHRRKISNLAGFTNGILRNIAREKENIVYPSKQKDTIKYLSVTYSIPEWVIKMWLKDYGVDITEKTCEALNERATVSIRVNLLRSSVQEVKEVLEKEGILTEKGAFLEEALTLKNVSSIGSSPSFKEGLWTVQDESAMLVASVVDPKPGEKVLDMCSAPGGKSMHLAEKMQNVGTLISADVHEHKMELIEKGAKRMGLSIIQPIVQDGTKKKVEWENTFDRVLLDAPCLGLGIVKRKPDIRYNRKEEDIATINKLQQDLLDNAIYYTKPEGVLVYSTCSISKAENEQMLAYAEAKGMVLESIKEFLPNELHEWIEKEGAIQIFPFVAGTDGFFIARFRKRGNE